MGYTLTQHMNTFKIWVRNTTLYAGIALGFAITFPFVAIAAILYAGGVTSMFTIMFLWNRKKAIAWLKSKEDLLVRGEEPGDVIKK